MLFNIFIFILGLVILVWSADRFVFGAAAIARNFGLSPMLIGLTVVAMGSSAPEMFVAADAAMNNMSDTAVGNVLGSNITNVTLVLGMTALLGTIAVSSGTLRREIPIMIGATLVAGYVLYDSYLTVYEGLLLLVVFFAIMSYLIWYAFTNKNKDPLLIESESEIPEGVPNKKAIFWFVLGLLLLPLAADWMVEGAVGIAKAYHLSDLVIGLTIIAIGTSLPELAACVAAVVKKENDLAIGNIVGSNIFNILAVLAVPAIINPGAISPEASSRDFYITLGTSVGLSILLLLSGRKKMLKRWHGMVLLCCFIAYQLILFQ